MKINLPNTLSLTEEKSGFWLYDKMRNMNIALRQKTLEDAFIKGLIYYQHRLAQVEKECKELNKKVNAFLEQFSEGENNEDLD